MDEEEEYQVTIQRAIGTLEEIEPLVKLDEYQDILKAILAIIERAKTLLELATLKLKSMIE